MDQVGCPFLLCSGGAAAGVGTGVTRRGWKRAGYAAQNGGGGVKGARGG
eukprot:COSAG02_NODE_12244_length_1574_cov_1.760000_1_plen_48_part_10